MVALKVTQKEVKWGLWLAVKLEGHLVEQSAVKLDYHLVDQLDVQKV